MHAPAHQGVQSTAQPVNPLLAIVDDGHQTSRVAALQQRLVVRNISTQAGCGTLQTRHHQSEQAVAPYSPICCKSILDKNVGLCQALPQSSVADTAHITTLRSRASQDAAQCKAWTQKQMPIYLQCYRALFSTIMLPKWSTPVQTPCFKAIM